MSKSLSIVLSWGTDLFHGTGDVICVQMPETSQLPLCLVPLTWHLLGHLLLSSVLQGTCTCLFPMVALKTCVPSSSSITYAVIQTHTLQFDRKEKKHQNAQ